MWRWFKWLGTAAAIVLGVVGLGGVENDFAGWRKWIDAMPAVVYPQGALILGGIALFVAFNAPSRWWKTLWSQTVLHPSLLRAFRWFSDNSHRFTTIQPSAYPNVEYKEAKVGLIYPKTRFGGKQVDLPQYYVGQLWFANELVKPRDEASARSVVATIEFRSVDTSKLLFQMPGKWLDALGDSLYGWRELLPSVDIEANGRAEKLIFVIKYPDEDDCFGFNAERVTEHQYQLKDERKRLPKGTHHIQVRLKGNNMSDNYWFQLINEGLDGSMSIEAIKSPS